MNLDLGEKKPSILTTELWLAVAAAKFIWMPALERPDPRTIDWVVVVCSAVVVAAYIALRQWVKVQGIKAGWSAGDVASLEDPKTAVSDPENSASTGSPQPS